MADEVKIEQRDVAEACTEYLNIFAANKNLYRVIPSLIDGLKPGLRRILYSMYIMGNHKKFHKVTAYVGFTMGHFHPHGDASIYDTLVGSAQWWNNNMPVIDGQGNFGSVAGDSAAAGRYIEARLSEYAYKCFFEDFKNSIVDMKDNFAGDELEPEYLPAKYPHVLLNGPLGIGTGMSSNIPAYNFKEVMEATIKLIKNPDSTIFLIPDSPTGAIVLDEGKFQDITDTGKGTFTMRGEFVVNEKENCIEIVSIPYQMTLDKIKDKIIDLIDEKKITGIIDIKDNSNEENGISCKLILKPNINPYEIIDYIYKRGASVGMEKTYPVNINIIDDYKNNELSVKDFLLYWIEYRRDNKICSYNHTLMKLEEEKHINSILLFILNKDNAENTLSIIKKSNSTSEVVEKLMKKYSITSLQAKTIAEMRMSSFTKDAYNKYKEKAKTLEEKISTIEKIVSDPSNIDKIIIDELKEGIKLFGVDRKSKVLDITKKKEVVNTEHFIIISDDGYIKKSDREMDSFGTVGKNSTSCKLHLCMNRDKLLVFDSTGKVSKVAVSSIPNGHDETDNGIPLERFFTISGKIVDTILELDVKKENEYMAVLITKKGMIKKVDMFNFKKMKNNKSIIKLDEDDELVAVSCMHNNDHREILIYTNKGRGIRLNTDNINVYKLSASGDKSLILTEGEHISSIDTIIPDNKLLLFVTASGKMKVTEMKYFPKSKRRAEPMDLINLDNNEEIKMIKTVNKNNRIKLLTRKGIVHEIEVSNLKPVSRLARAEKLLKNMRGDEIVHVLIQ